MNTSETPWPGISIPTAVPERSVRVLAAAKAVVASQPRLFKEPGVEGGALLTWEDLGRSGKDMEGPVSTRGGLGVMWGKLCGTSLFGGLDQVIPSHTKSYQVPSGKWGFHGVPIFVRKWLQQWRCFWCSQMCFSEYTQTYSIRWWLSKWWKIEAVEAQEWMLFDSWIPCDYFAQPECVAIAGFLIVWFKYIQIVQASMRSQKSNNTYCTEYPSHLHGKSKPMKVSDSRCSRTHWR